MTGLDAVARNNGTVEYLEGIMTIGMQEKDVLVIKTPYGGGGAPAEFT